MALSDAVFDILVDCAVAGLPSPTTKEIAARLRVSERPVDTVIAGLVERGMIRTSRAANRRIVTILDGPAAGRSTTNAFDFAAGSLPWPKPGPDRLAKNCFAAHNLKLRPQAGRLPGATSPQTLAGVTAAWLIHG